MSNTYHDTIYEGERALFASQDATIVGCTFQNGESPLKESKKLNISNSTFKWKYPLWYCEDVVCRSITLDETARSGIWYTKNIKIFNSLINAPKTFRRADHIFLEQVKIPNAQETFWKCSDIHLESVEAKGDYFGFNSTDIVCNNLTLDGNYAFDGAKNITIRDSVLYSKDSFWNTENVTIINSTIIGEYLGWNSKNLTLINCTIKSHQGLCYIDGLKMISCKMYESDLCFEYCSNVLARIITSVDSIKNPYSGRIHVKEVKELIMDEKYINPRKTQIFIGDNHEKI